MSLLDEFRDEVERYLQTSGVTPTAFGQAAVGDPNFVFDLREGREPRMSTIERVQGYMQRQNGVEAVQ